MVSKIERIRILNFPYTNFALSQKYFFLYFAKFYCISLYQNTLLLNGIFNIYIGTSCMYICVSSFDKISMSSRAAAFIYSCDTGLCGDVKYIHSHTQKRAWDTDRRERIDQTLMYICGVVYTFTLVY